MCMLNTCQQVAILSNIVELSSRKAEVQIHHRSISRVTAVYNQPVKKWRIKPTTRIHSIWQFFCKSQKTFWCFVSFKAWVQHFNNPSISLTQALNLTSPFKKYFLCNTLKSCVVIVIAQIQDFYGTSCLFSKRGKIGQKANCAESGLNNTFKPSLHNLDTTVHSLLHLRIQLCCHKHVHAVILRLILISNKY